MIFKRYSKYIQKIFKIYSKDIQKILHMQKFTEPDSVTTFKDVLIPLIESIGTKKFVKIFFAEDAERTVPNAEEFILCENNVNRKTQLENEYIDAYAVFEYEFMKKNMHLLSPAAIAKTLETLLPKEELEVLWEECENANYEIED
jgi:hypothetical protein